MIKDEISACRKTYQLWMALTVTGSEDKNGLVRELFNTSYTHNCPCCQYSSEHGAFPGSVDECICPLEGFWKNKLDDVDRYTVMCEGYGGEYRKWCNAGESSEVRMWYAEVIRDLAKEGLDYWEAMRDMNICW